MKSHYLKFFLLFLFTCNSIKAQSCSSYRASQLVDQYEARIMRLLKSEGDTNISTSVINCQHYTNEDIWVIEHKISFNGFWSGDYYEARGKLTVKPHEWEWKYIEGNDNMDGWLVLNNLANLIADEMLELPNGDVESVWTDFDQYSDGKRGLWIHSKVSINYAQYQDCQLVVWFYHQDGRKLKSYDGSYQASDNQVAVWKDMSPTYEKSIWKDFQIFMPYDELEVPSGKTTELYFRVGVYLKDDWEQLDLSEKNYFSIK